MQQKAVVSSAFLRKVAMLVMEFHLAVINHHEYEHDQAFIGSPFMAPTELAIFFLPPMLAKMSASISVRLTMDRPRLNSMPA